MRKYRTYKESLIERLKDPEYASIYLKPDLRPYILARVLFKPDLRPSGDSADDAIFWRLKRGNF